MSPTLLEFVVIIILIVVLARIGAQIAPDVIEAVQSWFVPAADSSDSEQDKEQDSHESR